MNNILPRSIFYLALLFLTGCASNIPDVIRNSPENSPTVGESRQDYSRYIDSEVRWGGQIARVENLTNETRIEIVSRQLDSSGRPVDNDYSDGRFIAKFPEFLDPAVYSSDREITIYGIIDGSEEKLIDEYHYRYPTVRVKEFTLWQPRVYYRSPYYPYYYDPWFYHPWYYRYPYYW